MHIFLMQEQKPKPVFVRPFFFSVYVKLYITYLNHQINIIIGPAYCFVKGRKGTYILLVFGFFLITWAQKDNEVNN